MREELPVVSSLSSVEMCQIRSSLVQDMLVSQPYVAMTVALMRRFGAEVKQLDGLQHMRVRGCAADKAAMLALTALGIPMQPGLAYLEAVLSVVCEHAAGGANTASGSCIGGTGPWGRQQQSTSSPLYSRWSQYLLPMS